MSAVHVSATGLIFAAVSLAAAIAVYGLFVLADIMLRRGTIGRREIVMLPGLALVVTVIGLGLEWTDTHRHALLAGVAFSAFLGLNIGRMMPRSKR